MTKAAATLEMVDPNWEQLILICRKCSRKLGGGFGLSGRESLRSELKRALRTAELGRSVRAVEVGCLSVCPRNAVSVVAPSRSAQVLTVPAGTDPAAVLALVARQAEPHESVRPGETPH